MATKQVNEPNKTTIDDTNNESSLDLLRLAQETFTHAKKCGHQFFGPYHYLVKKIGRKCEKIDQIISELEAEKVQDSDSHSRMKGITNTPNSNQTGN